MRHKAVHHLLAAVHSLDVAMNLAIHLIADKLIDALYLDAVNILCVKVGLSNRLAVLVHGISLLLVRSY